jgi:hypothetical protein
MSENTERGERNEQSNIERIVMQRVHLIRALRFVIGSGALSMLVSLVALWGIGREVWVAHVLQNAPKNIGDLPQFYLSAFEHTNVVVQALVLVALAAVAYLAREIIRLLGIVSTPSRA